MGKYNPHAPTMLGCEWVPIVSSPYDMDTETERGYTFVLDTVTTVVSGSVFIDDVPAGASNKGVVLAVYEGGTEDLTGPLQRVVVPAVSGTYSLGDADASIDFDPNVGTFASVFQHTNDGSFVRLLGDSSVQVYFNTNSVSSQLTGKRIVAVNFLYTVYGTQPGSPGPTDITTSNFLYLRQGGPGSSASNQVFHLQGVPNVNVSATAIARVDTTPLGNVVALNSPFCENFGTAGFDGTGVYPWRYPDLQRFEPANAVNTQIMMHFSQSDGCTGCTSTFETEVRERYAYAALEIIYCEEKRLLYGAKGWNYCAPHLLVAGQNKIMLRPSSGFGLTGLALQPGVYTITVTMADVGQYQNGIGGNYRYRALRQLFGLPTHAGVEMRTSSSEGGVFRSAPSDIIPAITLHTTSGVVTGTHSYHTQLQVPVYGGVSPTQDILQDTSGVTLTYPQVRFYARRIGDTTASLSLFRTSDTTQRVTISPEDLDALDEIVDGWREVTLRFDNPPTFSGIATLSEWTWEAPGLAVADQWQVLGADAQGAVSAPFNTDATTYGGANADLSEDDSQDAVIIFSQDPPAVTGLAVTVEEQSLEPVGAECLVEPECVPTALSYHLVTWEAQDVLDAFDDRTTTNGWDDADSGQEWSHSGGTIDDYFVQDGAGVQRIDVTNTRYVSMIDIGALNVRVLGHFRLPVLPATAPVTAHAAARFEDTSNFYEAQLSFAVDGTVQLFISRVVGGVGAIISQQITLDTTHTAGDEWFIEFTARSEQLLGRAWKAETTEPPVAQVTAVALTGENVLGNLAAFTSRATTGNTNVPFEFEWLEVSATNVDADGFELQRSDVVDDEWRTIMRSTGLATREFADYEARVGVESSYRIRTVNVLEFYGEWSVTGTSTLPAPGVVGAGTDGNSVMIFTTNERQDGSSNLAYVMVWTGDVEEDFAFPEAGTVQLRDLFRRDYPLAFAPLERGGERFSRDILVHNAAVPTGRIRDGFRSLRDMAWEDVSYVCVRNELGDRWFANVRVPSGKITRNRRLYVARIEIAEVSEVPSQVDPTA